MRGPGLWGHLFGGRYKSVGVQENEHLAVLIDYVHLNPFRAGLVSVEGGIEDYLQPARQRSDWVRVESGLAQRGYPSEKVAERRRYLRHLKSIARDEGGVPGVERGFSPSAVRSVWTSPARCVMAWVIHETCLPIPDPRSRTAPRE